MYAGFLKINEDFKSSNERKEKEVPD